MHNPLALYAILHPHDVDLQRPPRRPHRRSTTRRIVVVVALVLAAVLVLSIGPAAAAPGWYDRPDPVGDGRLHRNNDIVRVRFSNLPHVKLRLTTRASVDPRRDPAWHDADGSTRLVWSLDTDGDPAPEFRVSMASTADGPGEPAVIALATGAPFCQPEFTYATDYQGGRHLLLSFRSTCLGSPERVAAQVRYRYDPPSGPARTDVAPNGGYTPAVTNPYAV